MMMNKLFYTIVMILVALIMACENDRQQFDTGISALNISVKDTVYSFAVKPSSLNQDTFPLYIDLVGEMKDYVRTFQLRATAESNLSEEHYQLPELTLAAGRVSDTLGLLLFKKSGLEDTTFLLELELIPNENFRAGVSRKIRLHVGNKLVKPGNWETNMSFLFGVYSEVKHALIIDATGVYDYSECGLGTLKNLTLMTKNYLAELNIRRKEEGKGPLEDESGREVVIGTN